jgi:hypothetical protein
MNPHPLIHWRVVGVALAAAVLFVITTMLALKAWADGRRSTGTEPARGSAKSVQPLTRGLPVGPVLKFKENSLPADFPQKPDAVPAKPPAKPAKEEMVAKVENPAPSGFN